MTEQIYQAIHQNSVIYAAFLDISSAYDSVWRDGLRYKLRTQFHLNGRMYWWIDSFLQDRNGKVVLNGTQSEWSSFKIGVPQGSSLSPILFIMFINDIVDVIHHSKVGLFADDIGVWSAPTTAKIEDMTQQHNQLQKLSNGRNNG